MKLRARWLALWPGSISRIEPTVGSDFGIPDTLLAYGRKLGLVEFKVVEDGKVKLRPQQRLWFKGFIPHSKAALVCGLHPAGFFLLPGYAFTDTRVQECREEDLMLWGEFENRGRGIVGQGRLAGRVARMWEYDPDG